MKVRMVGALVCLSVLVINCNKFVKTPPVNPPQQPSSQSNLPEKPEYLKELNKELERYPDIVRKLQVIYDQASEYHARNNILAARQVYEEGVDMIFDYEEDDDHIKYPEYLVLKEKILQDFQIILRKEGFEINETSTDILQQEIDILRVIIDAER